MNQPSKQNALGTTTEALLQLVEPVMEVLRGMLQLESLDGLMLDAKGDSMLGVALIEADESSPRDCEV